MRRMFIYAFAILVLAGVGFSIDVSTCQVINAPGVYDLNTSIVSGTPQSYGVFGDTCIGINTSDVVLNCAGFTVDAGTSSMTSGIIAVESTFGPVLNNITIANCTVTGNFTFGIQIRDVENSTLRNNTVEGLTSGFSVGFELEGSNTGTTIINNTARNNPDDGFEMGGTSGHNNLVDNFAYNNGGAGFVFDTGQDNNLTGCVAYNNTVGFYVGGESDGNRFVNNSAFNNTDDGFTINEGNTVLINDLSYQNLGDGYEINAGPVNITESNATLNGGNGLLIQGTDTVFVDPSFFCNNAGDGILISSSTNVTVLDSVVCNNTANGISISSSAGINVTNNTISQNGVDGVHITGTNASVYAQNIITNNTGEGFDASTSNESNFTGNTATFNGGRGLLFSTSKLNLVSDNTFNNNSNTGVQLSFSTNNTIRRNVVANNTFGGFTMAQGSNDSVIANNTVFLTTDAFSFSLSSSRNLVANNTAFNNSGTGFRAVSAAANNTFQNNLAYRNLIGFDMTSANGNNLTNNTAHSNTRTGINIGGANTNISASHLYNNSVDLAISGTFFSVSMSGMVFDNALGSFANYSNVSLNDTIPVSGGVYNMTWSAQPAALPSSLTSFANKHLNITNTSSNASIDSIVWHWLSSESASYIEDRFQLWKFNASGWTLLNTSPDTAANMLSMTSLDPFSVFSILQNDGCPAPFTSPGAYSLSGNVTGAPNSASPLPGSACVKIAASNVDFDCAGFSITNNGTAGTTYGVLVHNSSLNLTNVTVRNCIVSNYTNGIHFENSTNSSASDNTVSFFTSGFVPTNSPNITFINNTAFSDGSGTGFLVTFSPNNAFINNTAHSATIGFRMSFSSDDSNLTNNTAYNNTGDGFFFAEGSDQHTVMSNTAYNNSLQGFEATVGSDGNTFDSNLAFGNGGQGFGIFSNSGNTLTNNVADNNTGNGFELSSSDSNTLTSNNASGNGFNGLELTDSNGNMIDPSFFCNNGGSGIVINNSNNTMVEDSSVCNNSLNGIHAISSTNLTLSNNTANNNSITFPYAGFRLESVSGTTLTDNTATGEYRGFHLSSSPNNSIDGNSVSGSDDIGLYVTSSSDSNMITDNLVTTSFGLTVQSSSGNVLIGNTVRENTVFAFFMDSAPNITAINNTAYNNTPAYGFLLQGSVSGNYSGNNISFNENGAILTAGSDGNSFAGNNISDNNQDGIYIDTSDSNSLSGNTISGNAARGIYLFDANLTSLSRDHLYGNTPDMGIESAFGSPFDMTMVGVIFDSDAGTFTDYTNISSTDTVELDGSFTMDWSAQPALLPAGRDSFANKHINITLLFGSTSIDSIAWNWLNSELPGYNESRFELWKFNSTWTALNTTPDTAANTLSLSALSSFSTFSILQFNDTIAPNVTLNSPPNGSIFNVSTVTFNFTATDNVDTSMNCSIFIDGSLSQTNGSTQNGTPTTFTETGLSDGNHTWRVECTDDFPNTGVSETRDFIVDTAPPSITLNSPANGTVFNVSTVDLNITAVDNFWPTMSCTVSVSGPSPSSITNASVQNGTPTIFTFSSLSDGFYNWTANCTDGANNTALAPTRQFTVDTTPPVVTLNSPPDGFISSLSTMNFNFTATDNLDPLMNCTLFMDGNASTSGTAANGTPTVFSASGLGNGLHIWFVRCFDDGFNNGTSPSRNFTVMLPTTGGNEDGGGDQPSGLQLDITPLCGGFSVTVEDGGGDPVEDAFLEVTDETNGEELTPRYTDASGKAYYTVCGIDVDITASKSGDDGDLSGFAACGVCEECQTNAQCPQTEQCVFGFCEPVQCTCGTVSNHQCVEYQCCADADCAAGQVCQDHLCVQEFECDLNVPQDPSDDNADCADTQFCDIPPGQSGGSCKDVTGACGYPQNHTWVTYECGPELGCPQCPADRQCVDHLCVLKDIQCPVDGIVGTQSTCRATVEGAPCALCDLLITGPDGKTFTGKTLADGSFRLPLQLSGIYKIALIGPNGTIIKQTQIRAQTYGGPDVEPPPTGTGEDPFSLLWLLILLLVVIVAIVYWRRRSDKSRK